VTADILKNAIVQKTITIPGSTLSKPLEPAQADVARNSLVMHLYQLVFDWCTHMINEYISVDNPEVCIRVPFLHPPHLFLHPPHLFLLPTSSSSLPSPSFLPPPSHPPTFPPSHLPYMAGLHRRPRHLRL
jgi:hypothetical protein